MGLPNVTPDELIRAMRQFDATQREGYDWKQNTYVVVYEGRHYPPKAVVSIATGRSVDTFSGGKAGANRYLAQRGFTIVDLRDVGREQLHLSEAAD
jgi:hypothetical protein